MSVPSVTQIEELQREAFNILPGTVNARRGAAVAHVSEIFQDIPVTGRSNFENELAKEAAWVLQNHLHCVHFTSNPQWGFTSTPRRHPKEDRNNGQS